MKICDNCPYRGRCENMQRCIQGKNDQIVAQKITPPPLHVNTTRGPAMTSKPEPSSTFKRIAKKVKK
jgi:hypothetical protein